ncbi:MAG: type II toxin-antitoxin system RelE/ParE family toxin [Pyrinomonadaceae bacterium MAG19_C2-C3]|nr:type II toxin-antitoxin system RelE/ParE family toxin [Pyrinomonadaceae bacterium MAG19_C2-C3]
MPCEVEYTDEFENWWRLLSEGEQDSINDYVSLLEVNGVTLGHPYSSSVHGSRHGHLRELRVQHKGRPLRVLYAFDPRRMAILLIGGDKTGDNRWYEVYVPKADDLYDEYLETIRKEGLI